MNAGVPVTRRTVSRFEASWATPKSPSLIVPSDVSQMFAVDDPALVNERQGAEELPNDIDHVCQRQPTASLAKGMLEVAAREVLAHEEVGISVLADVKDGNDVRVRAEARDRSSLRSETLGRIVADVLSAEQCKRALAVERRVVHEVHDFLSTRADHSQKRVPAASEGGQRRHEIGRQRTWGVLEPIFLGEHLSLEMVVHERGLLISSLTDTCVGGARNRSFRC
jgi:hypothetical protein